MTSAQRVPLVSMIGVLWPGILLLTLFSSTIIPAVREFVMGLGFGTYIALWIAAVAPSVVLVWLGEKAKA
jgi:hypothetical protein